MHNNIITGKYKNQKLKTSGSTNSVSFTLRNALFNILGPSVINAAVLDLFAGDGSFSIEALSRGARSAIVNDNVKKNLNIAKQNIEKICKEERILFMNEQEKFIKLPSFNNIDLIFCNSFNQDAGITEEIIKNIQKNKGNLKKIIFCAIADKNGMDLLNDTYKEFEPRKFGAFFLKILSI